MATRPSLFDWASDANWASGPRTGNATKVTPSASEQAQGHVGGLTFKTEHANWALNLASLGLEWAGDQIANVLDGGTEGSNTELRDAVGRTGQLEFEPAGNVGGVPTPGAATPSHRSPGGRVVHFARELTTVGGTETLTILHNDVGAFSGVGFLEYFVVAQVTGAGTPIDAVGFRSRSVFAGAPGSLNFDGSSETFDVDSSGGAGLAGLTFSAGVQLNTIELRINDSSSPRTVRVTGWAMIHVMNATG